MATVPQAYSRSVHWLPQIGDVVPNFLTPSTQGTIAFHTWAQGSWVFLFSHPAPFTPVCTTELASFAASQAEFQKRGVRLLGVSSGSVEHQARWHADIERLYGLDVNIPMIGDETGLLTDLFGMNHPEQSHDWTIRKSFIIGPDLKVRMIFEYPIVLGRSTEEVLRCIDGLQTAETFNVGLGADWQRGDDVILLPEAMGQPRFDHANTARRISSYLWMAKDPWSCPEGIEEAPETAATNVVAISRDR